MIPQTYDEWRHCIEHQCGIALTPEFVRARLAVYEDAAHPETKDFARLYGSEHLQNIISWLRRS